MNTLNQNETGRHKNSRLWERILNGDRKALALLFEKFYVPFLNYGLKLIAREDLVKDSIQELFFTIWEKREQLSHVENVQSYLYCSFRRAVFRQNQIKKDRGNREQKYFEESFKEIFNKEQLMVFKELRREQKKQLEKAICDLSKRQKEVIFLKFYNGLSNSEIALVMNIKKQSVYNHVHRATMILQDSLEEKYQSREILKSVSHSAL